MSLESQDLDDFWMGKVSNKEMNNIQNCSKKKKLLEPICSQSSVSPKQCNLLIFIITHFRIQLTHQTYIIIKENSQIPISPIWYKYPHQNSSNRKVHISSPRNKHRCMFIPQFSLYFFSNFVLLSILLFEELPLFGFLKFDAQNIFIFTSL